MTVLLDHQTPRADLAPPPPAAGEEPLILRLRREAGIITPEIRAPRPVSLGRMAGGQTPEAAARLAGLVFNTCAAAQEGATRAAFGLPQSPGAGRRIALECLRDHALRMAVAWPRALGQPPEPETLRAVARIDEDQGASLAEALFGPEGAPARLGDFETWLQTGETAGARAIAHVWTRWDSRWARAATPLWRPGAPFVEVDWLAAEIDGRAVDISTAARVAEHDLMREIEARRGRGLAWRMAARVVDAARLIDGLADGSVDETPRALAPGLGVAPAARGAMLVKGAAVDGRVAALARLSPTDCALHPHGVLALSLAALPRRRRAPVAAVAALTVECVDPCLPHKLILEDGPDV